ncbi:MAG: proprotein convertase P-domain-containing protein [Flavobacteriales bacterium]|nr:proprotein convertase P-domain-containing protein [Flavobacteriales bacterium]
MFFTLSFDVKSQVFSSSEVSTIPYLNFTYSEIEVTGISTVNCDFTVCIDVSHDRISDVEVALIAPSGTYVYLAFDNGGLGDDYINTCFSMGASVNITDGTPPFTGDYIPQEDMSVFNNESAVGTWQLAVLDNQSGVTGTLDGWSIDFSCVTSDCEVGEEEFVLNLFDSWGDGWDHGSGHLVTINGVDYGGLEFVTGNNFTYDICLDTAECYEISFTDGGLWEYECSFNIQSADGSILYSGDYTIEDEIFGEGCGCTDPAACNYDPNALQDDGSCVVSPLDVSSCEELFCGSQVGEQVASQYIGTNINYLTIEIDEEGVLNELFYDVNWHSHGWGSINFNVNNATIDLFDDNGVFIENLAVIGNNVATTAYQNFTSTISTAIDVLPGYTIQVFINSPNWGLGTWDSYVNQAIISFTIETEELINFGTTSVEICSNDGLVNLYDNIPVPMQNTGSWSPTLANGSLGTFNPLVDTEQTYTYEVVSSCITQTIDIDVSVIPYLLAGTSTVLEICPNDEEVDLFDLVGSDASQLGSWSPALSNGYQGTFNPETDAETQYTYTVESQCGVSSADIDVQFFDLAFPDAVEIALCNENTPTALFNQISTVTTTGSWSGPSSLFDASSPQHFGFFNPTIHTEGTYIYTVENVFGCEEDFPVNVSIINEELNAGTDTSVQICSNGESIDLFDLINDADVTGIWQPNLDNGHIGTYNPATDAPGSFIYTITGECSSVNAEVFVNQIQIDAPEINFDEVGDSDNVCFGSTSEIYSTPNSPNSNYLWTVSGGGIIVGDANSSTVEVDWSNSTVGSISDAITLTESYDGCSYSSSIDVEIIANPIPDLSIDDNEICIGESIQFSTSAGYVDYDWSNNTQNVNSFTYTPLSLADNQFSVTVTGDASCTTTSTVSITINDLPFIDISISDDEICSGESLEVTATPAAYVSYDWLPNDINNTGGTYFPDDNQNSYSVTVTDINGCVNSTSENIVIFPIAEIGLGVDQDEICIGDDIQLSANFGFDNYDWSNTTQNTNTFTYTPSSLIDNQFYITTTGIGGCTSSDSIFITINDLPVVDLSLSETEICLGESIEVTSTPSLATYTWIPASLTGSGGTFTPELSQTFYSVVATDNNGCINTNSASLTINQIDEVDILVNGSPTRTICIGEEIQLSATQGFTSYSWFPNSVSSAWTTDFEGTYVPLSLTDNQFTLTVTNEFGCQNTSNLIITIKEIPTPGAIGF